MNIIHLSDLHLTSDKSPIWRVNTNAQFIKALEKIRQMSNIDCIIVTGDIADDGQKATYLYADQEFKKIGIETFWCYGNHDCIDTMNSIDLHFVKICDEAIFKGVHFIFLNSVAKDKDNPKQNRTRGVISDFEYRRLNDILKSEKCYPVIIAMHHPCFDPGGWLSEKILKNRELFNNIVTKYGVACVIYGHIHSHTEYCIDKTIFTSASSIGFAFDKELPKYEIAEGKEGFSLIKVNNSISIENIMI